MRVAPFSFVVYFLLCLPNLHAINSGLPYLIHITVISCFLLVILHKPFLTKNIQIIFIFLFFLLAFAVASLLRQNILTGVILASDFGFLAKLIILLLAILLGSTVSVEYEVAKKTIILSLILIVLCALMQFFMPTLSVLYNNVNLIQQGRFGSFGITHYEATSLSVLLCGFYLAVKFRENERLANWEGAAIMITPMVTSILSMSKAALIVCFLWFLLSFFYLRNKKVVLVVCCFGVAVLLVSLNQYIMVLYYGLSDLTRLNSTGNLSIITRIEDISNFKYLFGNHNLIFSGIGTNRASYFHYFEIGLLSNIVNIGLVGTIFYYTIMLYLIVSLFPRHARCFSYSFFILLFIGDCIVNFNDGVKSLLFLGLLSMVTMTGNNSCSVPNENLKLLNGRQSEAK